MTEQVFVASYTYVRRQRGTAHIRPMLLQQSIDISCPPGPQQQTCNSELRQSNGTDRRTPYPFIDPAPHTGSAKNSI